MNFFKIKRLRSEMPEVAKTFMNQFKDYIGKVFRWALGSQ